MTEQRDFYAVLGLLPDADPALIKAAYRVLAKRYHPDLAGNSIPDAQQRFVEIQDAYEVLGDAKLRAAYDSERASDIAAETELPEDIIASDEELDREWEKMVAAKPELATQHAHLAALSVALSNGFKFSVLELKNPEDYRDLAIRLEKQFLRKYFSRYKDLQNLAKDLLIAGKKDHARQLNEKINTLKPLNKAVRAKLLSKYSVGERTDEDKQQNRKYDQASGRKKRTAKSVSNMRRASWGFSAITVLAMAILVLFGAGDRPSISPDVKVAASLNENTKPSADIAVSGASSDSKAQDYIAATTKQFENNPPGESKPDDSDLQRKKGGLQDINKSLTSQTMIYPYVNTAPKTTLDLERLETQKPNGKKLIYNRIGDESTSSQRATGTSELSENENMMTPDRKLTKSPVVASSGKSSFVEIDQGSTNPVVLKRPPESIAVANEQQPTSITAVRTPKIEFLELTESDSLIGHLNKLGLSLDQAKRAARQLKPLLLKQSEPTARRRFDVLLDGQLGTDGKWQTIARSINVRRSDGMTASVQLQLDGNYKPWLGKIGVSPVSQEGLVPRPRPRPIEVLQQAAANMKIEPASQPVARVTTITKKTAETVSNDNQVVATLQIPKIIEKDPKRIALVVGNNAYSSILELQNPTNDATDMAAALRQLGFEVTLLTNGTRLEMENSLVKFSISARQAETALIFYAGHGLQHQGVNYLIPVDAVLNDPSDLRRLVKVQDMVKDLQNSKGVRILILDACRDNDAVKVLQANTGKTRSTVVPKGLVRDRADGVVIAYATQPGQVAVDGENTRNSPFTSALLKHINTPHLDIRVMLARVRADVLATTEGTQIPETSDSMTGEFAFKTD